MMNVKLLDCTLRDGGYYTNWDFDDSFVMDYINAVNTSTINVIEIGYRSSVKNIYRGQYYYLPLRTIERIRELANDTMQLSLMINAKEYINENVEDDLANCKEFIDLIRIAISPDNLQYGLELARKIKDIGFNTTLNVMYMHKILQTLNILMELNNDSDAVDYVYIVDSYGSCLPNQVAEIINKAGDMLKSRIGFHGHDNIGLSFANTIAAIQAGAVIVDSSFMGMGRGAGNLKTELMSAYIAKNNNDDMDYSSIANFLDNLEDMRRECKWGYNLPYIFSGLEALPQKDAMDLLSMKRYSTSTIIKMLSDSDGEEVIANETILNISESDSLNKLNMHNNVLIIGGGDSAVTHSDAIHTFADKYDSLVIHSSLKYVSQYKDMKCVQVLCLAGEETLKSKNHYTAKHINSFFISVRNANTIMVPEQWKNRVYSIEDCLRIKDERNIYHVSPLGIALGIVNILSINNVHLAGFDGYSIHDEQAYLGEEVEKILREYALINKNANIISITDTYYDIKTNSVYSYI